jgi:hypothetical protein
LRRQNKPWFFAKFFWQEFRLSTGKFHGDIEEALKPIHGNVRGYFRNKAARVFCSFLPF